MTTYYKVTGPNATSCNGGGLQWSRPRGKRPGKWEHVSGEIKMCHNGLHAVTADHVLDWAGCEVWEVELGGAVLDDGKKVVARRARLLRLVMNEDALRHFAVWCAAQVLPIYESAYPNDSRVRDCLIASGPGSSMEARATAWAAAKATDWAAVWATAESTARAAAEATAWAAARAAETTAWATAEAVAAAKAAQKRRLKLYLAGKVNLTKPVMLPPRPKEKP